MVFADTSFYIAFTSPGDAWHGVAKTFAAGFRGTMVTTEFVLIELANALAVPRCRDVFVRYHAMLRRDPNTIVVPVSSEWVERGLALYADRPDKGWSLTDCISLAVMRDRGLTEALTSDHHFEQAGHRVLLAR